MAVLQTSGKHVSVYTPAYLLCVLYCRSVACTVVEVTLLHFVTILVEVVAADVHWKSSLEPNVQRVCCHVIASALICSFTRGAS